MNPRVRQNNVEELYSLLKFLRIKPLNDWQTFNEQINKPIKSGRSVGAMKRLHVSISISAVISHLMVWDFIEGRPSRNHASAP
jgi:SNF2 family DNA or RNA helicase